MATSSIDIRYLNYITIITYGEFLTDDRRLHHQSTLQLRDFLHY